MEDLYTEAQVAAVLNDCGIQLEGQTYSDFLALCPFHGNRRTPSFSVSRSNGSFICFSPECGEIGSLIDLVRKLKKKNQFQALRHIGKFAQETEVNFAAETIELLDRPKGFIEFPQHVLDKAYEDFWNYPPAVEYMTEERGFEEEILHKYRIGYSAKQDMIIVPMHDIKGMPIGLIGRSIEGKRFKNSLGLPTSQTLWNIHRIKRYSEVFVVESSFDAMMMDQAGFPNTAATLGGHMNPLKFDQLRRFDVVMPMTDDDEFKFFQLCRKCETHKGNVCQGHSAGLELGLKIERGLPNKDIYWPIWNNTKRFPAKDVGKMTISEIQRCVQNKISSFEFAGGERYRPQVESVV